MPPEHRHHGGVNPFESPAKPLPYASSTPAHAPCTKTQQPDVLATADLLLEQLKELENHCSTVEERVQRKRRALKELEYLILGSNSTDESPRSPGCPTNTPINPRLYFVSPRLRGLFDLHGPGLANLDAIQTCLDYPCSPETSVEDQLSTREDHGHSDEWVDDDDEALLLPFDDKYEVQKSPRKIEKALPAIPREITEAVLESRIPRKIHVRRRCSASRRPTGRPLGALTRGISHRGLSNARSVKTTNDGSDLTTKGTMRRSSWKRSILENAKPRGTGTRALSAIENESEDVRTRKGKRKALWSIYSVCSELGMSGTHHGA